MNTRTRQDWTPEQTLSVARLIVDPETNGGTVSDLTPEQVADAMPSDPPAWATFDDSGACLFVVGLNPYERVNGAWRGILHFARAGGMPIRLAFRLTQAFLSSLPGVEVFTFTDRASLLPLAERAGLSVLGVENGYTVLGNADAVPAPA